MHEQHDELVAARDQMQTLVRLIVDIGSELDLDVTLHRIVNAAMELTGARYGALGIRGSDGTLASFVCTTSSFLGRAIMAEQLGERLEEFGLFRRGHAAGGAPKQRGAHLIWE